MTIRVLENPLPFFLQQFFSDSSGQFHYNCFQKSDGRWVDILQHIKSHELRELLGVKNGESLLEDEDQHVRSFRNPHSIKEERFDWFSMLSSSIFILRMCRVFNVILIHKFFFTVGMCFVDRKDSVSTLTRDRSCACMCASHSSYSCL